jgi:hypothetical protein
MPCASSSLDKIYQIFCCLVHSELLLYETHESLQRIVCAHTQFHNHQKGSTTNPYFRKAPTLFLLCMNVGSKHTTSPPCLFTKQRKNCLLYCACMSDIPKSFLMTAACMLHCQTCNSEPAGNILCVYACVVYPSIYTYSCQRSDRFQDRQMLRAYVF